MIYRWKIYVVSLILCMVSLFYLDIQVERQADKQVQKTLAQWLTAHHGQVEHRIYHVLRDQLTLKGLNFSWNNVLFNVEQAQVQLGTMDGQSSKQVSLKGLQVALPDNQPLLLVKEMSLFLSKISQLKIEQAEVYLAKKTWLQDVSLSVESLDAAEKKLKASFFIGHGQFNLEGSWKNDHFSLLNLDWKDADISSLLRYADFDKMLSLKSSGHLIWKTVNGETSFQAQIQDDVGSFKIHGLYEKGQWDLVVDGKAFHLKPFIGYLPQFLNRAVVDGRVSGRFRVSWEDEIQNWTLKSHDLSLSQLELHDEQNNSWVFSSVRAEALMLSAQSFDISTLWLNQARVVITPNVLEEASIRLGQIKEGDIRLIHADQLTLVAQMPEGNITLPTFSAKGSFLNHNLEFSLTHKSVDGAWLVEGEWNVLKSSMLANIDVDKAPLALFRSLLSQAWNKKTKAEVKGRVKLQMQLKATDQRVGLSGDVLVNDLEVFSSGHQWQASLLKMDVKELGLGLEKQRIRSIQVKDWNYQFSLSPISEPMFLLAKESTYNWEQWQLGSVDMLGGSVSVARRDAVWLKDVTIRLKQQANHGSMALQLKGLMAHQVLQASGTLSPFEKDPSFDVNVTLKDVLPFFLNEWLELSGIPNLTQGRVSTHLHLYRDTLRKAYQGVLKLQLSHPIFVSGTFSHDPFIRLVGFNLKEVIQRVSKGGVWALEVPLNIPDEYVLSQDIIGQSILKAMKEQLVQASDTLPSVRITLMKHAIRLHEENKKDQLSFNERIRLKEVANLLQQDRQAIVILQPQLGNQALTSELKQHIDYTQKRIERLLRYKGASASQIFPVWPGAEHRQGDVGGILVVVQKVVRE